MPKTTVQLGGVDVALATPASAAARFSVLMLEATAPLAARGAALGICWAGAHRPRARIEACRHSYAAYGEAVFNELIDRGYPEVEVFAAGQEALTLLAEQLAGAQEVAGAEAHFGEASESSTG